jgi:methylated-DNA-[protein]-cysteine S-methyltransferase
MRRSRPEPRLAHIGVGLSELAFVRFHLSNIASPLDELLLVTDADERVRALEFADHKARLHRGLREHYGTYELNDTPAPPAIGAALNRYFSGDLTALEAIATLTAGSDLQRRVWRALRRIPAGHTMSYGELARSLGFADPRAAIDIGAANGANPVNLIVPCHRVIGSNGELKGYAGGVHRKRWLLQHEGVRIKATPEADALRLPGF